MTNHWPCRPIDQYLLPLFAHYCDTFKYDEWCNCSARHWSLGFHHHHHHSALIVCKLSLCVCVPCGAFFFFASPSSMHTQSKNTRSYRTDPVVHLSHWLGITCVLFVPLTLCALCALCVSWWPPPPSSSSVSRVAPHHWPSHWPVSVCMYAPLIYNISTDAVIIAANMTDYCIVHIFNATAFTSFTKKIKFVTELYIERERERTNSYFLGSFCITFIYAFSIISHNHYYYYYYFYGGGTSLWLIRLTQFSLFDAVHSRSWLSLPPSKD